MATHACRLPGTIVAGMARPIEGFDVDMQAS